MSTLTPSATGTAPERAAHWNLPKLGGRPPLRRYTQRLWGRRHFTYELAKSRFQAENEEDRLGILWTVLRPLINVVVYGAVFGYILASASRPPNFVPYLICGVFIFQYFQACLQSGARSIVGNIGLMRTLHFPRAVLPIAVVIQQILTLLPQVFVMIVLIMLWGERPAWRWFGIIPALTLMSMFCLGVAFVAARLTIHVRDIAQLIPYMARLLFYTSGVFFSIDRIAAIREHPILHAIFTANPVNVYIELVRASILEPLPAPKNPPYADAYTWQLGVVWAFVFMIAGFLFFWRAEERYGRD